MRRFIVVLEVVLTLCAAPASAADKPEALYGISDDFDGDGSSDRAVLVLVGPGRTDFGEPTKERYGLSPGERVDLYFYMGRGEEETDIALEPDFVKQSIVDPERTPWVAPPEVGEGHVLYIIAEHQWGASKNWAEALSIVFRNREPTVGGFRMDWDWNSHAADGAVQTTFGNCDVDLLKGKATITRNENGPRPIEGSFRPVPLADWSSANRPPACDDWK